MKPNIHVETPDGEVLKTTTGAGTESSIAGVTVFSSGAQILRTANVSVLPGRTEIIFNGLSNQLEQQSLQLKADATITLLSVQAIKDFTSQRKLESEEKNLINRRVELQDKIASDNRLLQVYKKEEEMLIKNQAIGGQTGVKTEELKQALDLHRARMTEVLNKQLEIEKRIASQQRELAKAGAQLTEIGKKRDSVNYTVTALIDSRETQNIKFQLYYTVKDAGWYPTYDVRVNDITKPLNVLMNANVFQRSGETWKDVAIQLSTGNPGDNATPSELQPWMLGFYDPSVAWLKSQATMPGVVSGRILDERGNPVQGASISVRGGNLATVADVNGFFKLQNLPVNSSIVVTAVGYNAKEIKAKPGYLTVTLTTSSMALQEVVVVGYGKDREEDQALYRKQAVGSALQGKAAGIEIVSVNTQYQPTTTVYKIDEKYTLETDGKTTTIGIKQIDIPALYEYFTAPKLDPSAFLTAKILNWQDYDLQSGESNLYFEGTFLGKTYLDLSTVGDTLSLSLGKDNSIKVSRKLLKEFSSKKFIGSSRTEEKEFEITVSNTKKIPVSITIQDQFPVSVTKEIEVKERKAPDGKIDDETGIVTWNLVLQPTQEKKVRMSYEVKYPKDRKVVLE
ncbi:MAG: mucoidy inhibitor MuiA family protein [Chitinophagaceae bacterium]|nr:MAG: mucoidy inhibitor MuiA family protein [Chitinophagaceae bacterium]